jgi:hypothetical protein
MGLMGVGYGSEFHLLRMLGRHRAQFDRELLARLNADGAHAKSIEWRDSPFNSKHKTRDGEWKSVDFLDDCGGEAWKEYWPDKKAGQPSRDGVPSWDAVGRLHSARGSEWLLVEAKAHEREFASPSSKCGAGEKSRRWISDTLRQTFLYCGGKVDHWSDVEGFWLGRGYQVANRLAVLRFLLSQNEPARLLYIYFIGDSYKVCPRSAKRWRSLIADVYAQMGLPEEYALSSRVHYFFPDVSTLRERT